MYEITKEIAEYIRKRVPHIKISKTMKQCTSRRGKYYVEETKYIRRLITQYKNECERVIEEYPISK